VAELSKFDITYEPRGSIKAWVLTDFVTELTTPNTKEGSIESVWILSVDGAYNLKGSDTRVILEGPDGVLVEQSLKFSFRANNNQAEYEALITRMILAKEMVVQKLTAKSDSQQIIGQVSGTYLAKDPQMVKYLSYVQYLTNIFDSFELMHIPRK